MLDGMPRYVWILAPPTDSFQSIGTTISPSAAPITRSNCQASSGAYSGGVVSRNSIERPANSTVAAQAKSRPVTGRRAGRSVATTPAAKSRGPGRSSLVVRWSAGEPTG